MLSGEMARHQIGDRVREAEADRLRPVDPQEQGREPRGA